MKKLAVLIVLLFVFSWIGLFAVDKEQADAWNDLIGEKDLHVKMQKLEDYYNKYGGQEDRNSMYMYLHLAETTYLLQQYDKTIQFGEKALTYKDIEAGYKLRLYLYLANAYNLTKKDVDKAYTYTELLIELAKMLRSATMDNSAIDNNYTAPALRIQVQLLVAKADLESTRKAFSKAIEAYQLDKSDKSAQFVLALSERLLSKFNKVEEAIHGVEIINQNKPNSEYYRLLGMWYNRLKNVPKTIENLQASYQLKKNAKVAYDLGVMLNQTQNLDGALEYLAEAYLLNDEKYSPEAQKLFEHLVFYEKTKGQPQAEQERIYNEILTAAKARLGITRP
jgi:hypothetical protein